MKIISKYISTVIIFYLALNLNIYGQGKTSSTIDIRIKIVSGLTTSIAKNGFVSEISPNNELTTKKNREILVQYYDRVNNNVNISSSKNELSKNRLRVLNSKNEQIADTFLENSISIKNLSKIDEIKFLPSKNIFDEKTFIEPSITIVY